MIMYLSNSMWACWTLNRMSPILFLNDRFWCIPMINKFVIMMILKRKNDNAQRNKYVCWIFSRTSTTIYVLLLFRNGWHRFVDWQQRWWWPVNCMRLNLICWKFGREFVSDFFLEWPSADISTNIRWNNVYYGIPTYIDIHNNIGCLCQTKSCETNTHT